MITAAAGLAVFVAVTTLFLAARPRKVRSARPIASEVGGTVTVEVAELRNEPSDQAPGAGALPRGARVRILADRGRWLEVRTGGKDATAFVAEEAVETDPQRRAREDRAKRIFSFAPVSGLVAEDTDVLLASVPSAPRSGRLRRGTAVSVYAVDHDYYAVRAADGGLAFLHSSDVDLVPPDPRLPAIVPAVGKTIKDGAIEAVHRSRDHRGQSVLTRTGRPRDNHAVRKAISRQHLADGVQHIRVAVKIRKRHSSKSVQQLGSG